MTEFDPRPELYGFFHEETFTSARQAADIRGRMTAFAAHRNYRLTKIYTEKPGGAPRAFNALFEAIRRDRVAVVVPTAEHLAPYGAVTDLLDELKRASGVPVLVSEAS